MPHLKDDRAKFLPHLGQKWQKTDYFQEFHFSLPVLKSQNDNNIISVFLN